MCISTELEVERGEELAEWSVARRISMDGKVYARVIYTPVCRDRMN
jgi:hypothetical protein